MTRETLKVQDFSDLSQRGPRPAAAAAPQGGSLVVCHSGSERTAHDIHAHRRTGLRGPRRDKVAVIARRPTRPLYRALRAGDPTRIQAAMEAWNPVLEVPVNGAVVAAVMESFGCVVDLIEERQFSPPGLEVLKGPSRPDGKTPFAQDVCVNCDARFGCASYRQRVRAQSPGRAEQALRDASADFGGDAEKQDWRDSGVTATARIVVDDEGGHA